MDCNEFLGQNALPRNVADCGTVRWAGGLARSRWAIEHVGLAKRSNASLNSLVHSFQQRFTSHFGVTFALVSIQQGMPHQRLVATWTFSKGPQCDPRWTRVGLSVRRIWHDGRRFNNLHVALRCSFFLNWICCCRVS